MTACDEGLDERKASQVPVWRTSDVFTPLERAVMELAGAMTATPPTVTDDQASSSACAFELAQPVRSRERPGAVAN